MIQAETSYTSPRPFATFTAVELEWLRTTAAQDVGLSLDVDETNETDERGQVVYASSPENRSGLLFWRLLATPQGVAVERSVILPPVMDRVQTGMVDVASMTGLREGLYFVAGVHWGEAG